MKNRIVRTSACAIGVVNSTQCAVNTGGSVETLLAAYATDLTLVIVLIESINALAESIDNFPVVNAADACGRPGYWLVKTFLAELIEILAGVIHAFIIDLRVALYAGAGEDIRLASAATFAVILSRTFSAVS